MSNLLSGRSFCFAKRFGCYPWKHCRPYFFCHISTLLDVTMQPRMSVEVMCTISRPALANIHFFLHLLARYACFNNWKLHVDNEWPWTSNSDIVFNQRTGNHSKFDKVSPLLHLQSGKVPQSYLCHLIREQYWERTLIWLHGCNYDHPQLRNTSC